MPRRRMKRYRRRRKSRSRKRSKRNTKNVLVNRGPSLVPDVFKTKMIFTSEENITAGVTRLIRGNSIFDPDNTNRRPQGYDEMAQLYDRYLVTASQIQITVINQDTSDQLKCVIYPASITSPSTDFENASAQPYAKSMVLGVEGSGQAVKTLKNYIATKAIRGAWVTNSEGYGATFTADPGFQWYWHFVFQTLIPAAVAMHIQTKVTYYVTLYRRDSVPQSIDPANDDA